MNMYFSTRTSGNKDSAVYKVHLMSFKEDFVEILKKLGKLPDTSLETHIGLVEDVRIQQDKL